LSDPPEYARGFVSTPSPTFARLVGVIVLVSANLKEPARAGLSPEFEREGLGASGLLSCPTRVRLSCRGGLSSTPGDVAVALGCISGIENVDGLLSVPSEAVSDRSSVSGWQDDASSCSGVKRDDPGSGSVPDRSRSDGGREPRRSELMGEDLRREELLPSEKLEIHERRADASSFVERLVERSVGSMGVLRGKRTPNEFLQDDCERRAEGESE